MSTVSQLSPIPLSVYNAVVQQPGINSKALSANLGLASNVVCGTLNSLCASRHLARAQRPGGFCYWTPRNAPNDAGFVIKGAASRAKPVPVENNRTTVDRILDLVEQGKVDSATVAALVRLVSPA